MFIKGQPELQGCPDTDRDGLSDIDDHCPYLRGQKANHGCPAGVTAAEVEPTMVVEFVTDEASLSPEFQSQLSDFAERLKATPAAHLFISRHTDSEGTLA